MKTVSSPLPRSHGRSRRAKVALGLLMTAAMAILVSLGVWQLQRKVWKEALIASIDMRSHNAPVAIPDEGAWAAWNPEADEFRHVSVRGTLLHNHEVPVYGLMPAEQAGAGATGAAQGSYLFTPLQLASGTVIFINRGFVPNNKLVDAIRPSGEITITGILRAPETRGLFVPENKPADGQWFTRDIAMMASHRHIDRFAPFYIEADSAGLDDNAAPQWPKGGITRHVVLKNDHLQYALTWFGLALVLAAMSVYSIFRK